MWKKTPGANNNRPHRRRRPGSLRRNRNTRASNNTPQNIKKEETPEPVMESRPSPITKEENSLTEDDVSECDSDSSATNKRVPTPTPVSSSELVGDESPSRMRTRNKQPNTKDKIDQNTQVKRPRRGNGADTPDTVAAAESPKTPSKTETKKKNSKADTPSKGKKRQNEIETEVNEGKDKRKRSDSPVESLNSDSRPSSVLDEAESASEPPEPTCNLTSVSKDSVDDNKLIDPLSIPLPETPSSSNGKDEITEEDEEEIIPPQSAEPIEEAALPIIPEETESTEIVAEKEIIEEKIIENYVDKEEEILTKIANIKQEVNPTATATAVEFASKEMIFIKREPIEDSMEGNSNSNNEPTDLKLKVEIKSEVKLNSEIPTTPLTESENKFEPELMKTSFEGQIKYDTHMKFGPDMPMKYGDPMDFACDIRGQMDYQQPEAIKYSQDTPLKYDMKSFLEDPMKNKISGKNTFFFYYQSSWTKASLSLCHTLPLKMKSNVI